MIPDFTYYKYKQLLQAIIEAEQKIYTIYDWYKQKPEQGIVIRHDVDRWAINSLHIAELEHEHGIQTTYYFRKTKGSFKPDIIKAIAALGHEIGYHYEDLSLAKGNLMKTKELFAEHLTKLREIAEVKTCAMHGRPFSKYDNRDIWKTLKLEDFGLEAEAFLSIDYSGTYYLTDTGRSWADNSINLRDKVNTTLRAKVNNTNELKLFIKNNPKQKIALVVHTERWPNTLLGRLKSQLTDSIINYGKKVISIIKKY